MAALPMQVWVRNSSQPCPPNRPGFSPLSHSQAYREDAYLKRVLENHVTFYTFLSFSKGTHSPFNINIDEGNQRPLWIYRTNFYIINAFGQQ